MKNKQVKFSLLNFYDSFSAFPCVIFLSLFQLLKLVGHRKIEGWTDADVDMRIVASMLEEPYWRIEEPNPMMAARSKARQRWKRTSMRIHHWVSLNEAAHWGCLTASTSLSLPHWDWLTVAASLRLHHCGCLTESTSLSSSLRLPHFCFITVAASLRLSNCGCLTVALYLNLHPSHV